MKVSLNWLRDYVTIRVPAQKLVQLLTNAGLEITAFSPLKNDIVFEVEITSNRPDWLSLIGIAREISVLTGEVLKPVKTFDAKIERHKKKPFSIEIEDKKACLRYVGRIMHNVNISQSPSWLSERLAAVGSRSINNAVDITNYCLFENGQPMHAFDMDKLEGSRVIVRKARDSEEIVTIDGVKRKLDSSLLVIADVKKPIAIAGIMGGLETEVGENTKNILLESAYFDPVTIRRAARKLGLSSESSYRFERNVDIENVMFTSNRGACLFREITKAAVEETAIDINYSSLKTREIKFAPKSAGEIIGTEIKVKDLNNILIKLGFKIKKNKDKNSVQVLVPGFRQDVKIPEDLIEEIARIWGYDNVEESLPLLKPRVDAAYCGNFLTRRKIRSSMLSLGLNEVISYTLLGKDDLIKSKTYDEKLQATIINPLSSEQECMRANLLPSFLKIISMNLNRNNKEVNIFELGKIYEKDGRGFQEKEVLGIAFCGSRYDNWQDHAKLMDFYDLKGMVENLFERFGINDIELVRQAVDFFDPAECTRIILKGCFIGYLGKIAAEILKNFDIKQDIFFAQLELANVLKYAGAARKFSQLAKYPSMVRDIAIVIKEDISCLEAYKIIHDAAGILAKQVTLFDVYTGGQIPAGFKSLAFSVEYQSRESTLTEEQINKLHTSVQDALIKGLNANLR